MAEGLAEIWVYLAREPLAALTVTLLAWLAALRLHRALGRHPLANPVLFAVALLAGGLLASGVEYHDYLCVRGSPDAWPAARRSPQRTR